MNKFPRLMLLLIFLLASAGIMPVAGQEDPGSQPDPLAPSAATTTLFLPITLNQHSALGVSGQVSDDQGQPLEGVVISNGDGITTTTDADGRYGMLVGGDNDYSFSPIADGVGFAPPVMDITVDEYVSNLDFTGMSGCGELVINGGFETGDGWVLDQAVFNTSLFNSQTRSLQLGNLNPAANLPAESGAMSAPIAVPADATEATLRVWLFTQSIASTSSPSSSTTEEDVFGPSIDPNDRQVLQVLDANGAPLKELLSLDGTNGQQWALVQFNLFEYRGNTIRLGFAVSNDGSGTTSAMFVDDVTLSTCPTMLAPDEYASGVSAPEAPSACTNQILNSGFEGVGGWGIPYTAYSAGYRSNAVFPNEVFAGVWSMRTGIPEYLEHQNRYSYSDAWQTVYIPNTSTSASLTLYNKMIDSWVTWTPETAEEEEISLAATEPQFAPGVIWGEQPLAGDRMYILVLNPYTGAIIQTLDAWDARSNGWKLRTYDLLAYRGRNIRIQFGTYNDGWNSVQSMYVDEVYVTTCDDVLPPPPPPPPDTTCPAGYTERLINTSFENSSGWYIPITAYTARYSNLLWHSGSRSLQTGIVNPWHNRYSYSDFGQYVYIPSGVSDVFLKFWVYRQSADGSNNDKQYLLVLNNWGYWIDTLLWNSSNNSSAWVEVSRNMMGWRGTPIRLQFGTYNNGWNGITSMYVDDVILCTAP